MSKPAWGKIGAWADEAERADEEEIYSQPPPPPQTGFPSLKEASATNTKQKKKTKMSLQEFTKQAQRNDDVDILRQLPTAPKQRSPDDEDNHFSGFSNYAQRSQEYRGSNSDQRFRREQFQSRPPEPQQPSRADEVDNWASMKKQTLNPPVPAQPHGFSSDQGPPRRYGSLGEASRADDVENWASVKVPASQPDRWAGNKGQSFGSGFSSSRPDTDRWVRNEENDENGKKEDENVTARVSKPNPFGAARPREEVLTEKGLDWKKIDLEIEEKKQLEKEKSSRPSSSQSSRPSSSQSNKSEVVSVGEATQRPKVNPFGDARPREVLLQERNLDWRKIDMELEHRRLGRSETEEEKKLKEEMEQLKKELASEDNTNLRYLILQKERDLEVLIQQLDDKFRYSQRVFERQSSAPIRGGYGLSDRPRSRPGSSGSSDRSHGDSRSRYHQRRPSSRPDDRPPSQTGKHDGSQGGFSEGPHVRPLPFEEPRNVHHFQRSSFEHGTYQDPGAVNYNGRPRSRGGRSSWTGPNDGRRPFQGGGGGRGFSSSRDMERSGSRW